MIQKLLKSVRKFVCSKLKTYKRNRYRCIQSPPPPDLNTSTVQPVCEQPDADVSKATKIPPKRHTIKEIREKNICFNAGEYTRNPFFNFLREYRQKHCGLTIVEQSKRAGAEWRRMTSAEKCKYVVEIDGKPPRRRRYKRRNIYWVKRS